MDSKHKTTVDKAKLDFMDAKTKMVDETELVLLMVSFSHEDRGHQSCGARARVPFQATKSTAELVFFKNLF